MLERGPIPIEYTDPMARGQQRLNEMTAEKTCPSRDEAGSKVRIG